jgi:hypothetical protein
LKQFAENTHGGVRVLKERGWKPRPFKNPKRQFLQVSPQPVKAVPSQGNL